MRWGALRDGRTLLLCSFATRLLWALLTDTYASPDEYWQGPEVAHRLVFGAGALTWEWWPGSRVRSWLHPLLLALGYAPLRLLFPAPGAPPLRLVWLAPRLVSAALAVAQDAAVWAHARALWGADAAAWAVGAQLCSWFSLFGGARAFGNSLQATLVAAACAAWDAAAAGGGGGGGAGRAGGAAAAAAAARRRRCGFAAGAGAWLAVSAHATSVPLLAAFAAALGGCGGGARAALPAAAAGGCAALLATQALDAALGGGGFTLAALLQPPPALAFLRANLGRGLDALSGAHPWHWYAWGGLPPALGALAPFAAAGLRRAWALRGLAGARARAPAAAALALLLALSLAAHKEHRYLLPLGPAASLYAGLALGGGGGGAAPLRVAPPLLGAAAAAGWAAAYYVAALHQRGPVAAAEFVARAAAASAPSGRAPSVHFLTPCHAAPLFAVLHYPRVEALFLDCSPGAAAGGPIGAAPRAAVCEASGCCGARAPLPLLTESAAWAADKGALLEALYGAAGCNAPRACARDAGGAGAPRADGRGAVPPARFAWAFGSPQCRAAMGAPPAAATALPCPTHAVLYDTDAAAPAAAAWLATGGYELAAAFPMGWVQGDAHAVAEGRGSPKAVGVWVHPCWSAAP
jgi:phosphatidylinositol glycan class B